MRDDRERIDCNYLDLVQAEDLDADGQLKMRQAPQCGCPGTANNPRREGRPFGEGCAKCKHNRWPR